MGDAINADVNRIHQGLVMPLLRTVRRTREGNVNTPCEETVVMPFPANFTAAHGRSGGMPFDYKEV
jgi:hypothetical protein